MLASNITVCYEGSGHAEKGVKVTLTFDSGQAIGYTNSSGVATVYHSSRGHAKVSVGGQSCGEFNAPGEHAAILRV